MLALERERETRNRKAIEILGEYLKLGGQFENPPEVLLLGYTQVPLGETPVGSRSMAVSAGLQCYGPGVVNWKHRESEAAQNLADDTLDAGHHSTRMHHHISFKLIGTSRVSARDIWHFTPFYNSSMQSQRYVEVLMGNFLIPEGLSERQRALYVEAANFANQAYRELLALLQPRILARIQAVYPSTWWNRQEVKKKKITPEDKAARLSMELARYVIPVCQRSIIDYTIDDISLLRLFHASLMPNFSQEARYLIAKMIFAYAQKDPEILRELDLPLSRQAPDYQYDSAVVAQFAEGQDEVLGGNVAQLLDISHTSSRSPSELLADFARVALGATAVSLPDEQILQRLLNPIFNPYLRDTYDVGMHDPLTASLKQINVQFLIKISYIIDQQRQRHRTISGITPTLEALYSGKPDFIIPSVIAQESSIVDFYAETMETIYAYVAKCLEAGIPKKQALLLLPNAQAIRLVESGDLLSWIHRFGQRLCLTAQDEIFRINVSQAIQILEHIPQARPALLALCGVNAEVKTHPVCPEDVRWCGRPMWMHDLDKYLTARVI